ncbi:Protein FANTASTIC FOUR 3 [Raphanus sativus]|uniref:Protein FANTASTIC FOUR 3 n=1 Tax=Raphanus sativus TaxID=3726 RepID=A0A6J0M974_RAPSA|nr:protein FANTASTIC FOUR 3 [Raphanus sativus]KAJ4910740.1 Protein FANTASTIC FOUR 3 [Raphanus sativus]
MGTVVYQQGFQSSQLNEPWALRLRLSSPTPHFSQPFGLALKPHLLDSSNAQDTQNRNDGKPAASSGTVDSSSWSFLQSLAYDSSSLSKTTSSEKEKTYVQRPSSSRTLSDESLALCTENLGSETGSDVTDVEDLFSLSSSDVQSKKLEVTTTETRTLKIKKGCPSNLPPPLTSMRGSHCIQMRPHREDGRLVMTATKAQPLNRCFQADRSNGRLRLSILKDKEEKIEPDEYEDDIDEEEDDDLMDMENVQIARICTEGDRENLRLLNWATS